MLLTEARGVARTDAAGALVPLDEQDRDRWDPAMIDEGVALVTEVLDRAPIGPYQLQAAIAAVHDEATSTETTDWIEILGLYDLLEGFGHNPVVTLNRAVAVGEVHGPQAGLATLEGLDDELRNGDRHRLHAVRGYLLVLAGDEQAAARAYALAAREATTPAERRHLADRAAQLSPA